ncbi:MAG: DUF45 domain-containing protein [Bacilli bacterium]|nr:DUF45 domain-containing protein [Bacilli bacterium]
MVSRRNYLYQGVLYEGTITRKRMRSLTLRVDPKKKTLRVSAPYLTSDKTIDDFVSKHLGHLLERVTSLEEPQDQEGIYVLGKKETIEFENEAEKIAYLKKIGKAYLQERVPYFEALMGIAKPYRFSVKQMTSRYGSNSRQTHRLAFAASLFHYAPATIDSVIVHELAHEFHRDHSKKFYEVVYRYCPDYKTLHAKLRKHRYE